MGNNQLSENHNEEKLQQLRFKWAVFAALTVLSTIASVFAMRVIWSPEYACRWVLIAGGVLTYQLAFIYRRTATNFKLEDFALLPTFGLGTTLTMLRGVLIAWTAGFLFSPRPESDLAWSPAILYTFAIILDQFDGYAARVRNQVTKLGSDLDTELDALGLFIAISLAIWYGTLPVWFLPIGLARYAFIFGTWLRYRLGLAISSLPPSTTRRPIAGLTMGFTSAMLWPIVSPPGSTLAGLIFLLPFAASFSRDWLVVSGVLDPKSIPYQRTREHLRTALFQWTPLFLRTLLVFCLGALIYNWINYPDGPSTTTSSNAGLLALGFIMIILGMAGRFIAFILVFPLGIAIINVGLGPFLAITLVGNLGILILGTGPFSLWQPEVKLFGNRWGEN